MNQLKLSIPNPCHEQQTLNKTSESTFFCNVCKETVVDLTQQTLDSDSIKDLKCVILSRKQLHWPQVGGSIKKISLSKPLLTASILIGISVTALGAYQESLTIPSNYAFDLLKFPCLKEKDTALSIKGN